MSSWKPYKFSDLVNIIGGGTPKTSIAEYWNGSIPWLSVVDFGGQRKTVYTTEKTITEKGLNESSTKLLKKGQLIISARGTVGEIAVLGADMAFNQSCYGLDAKSELAINNFLYYLLKYKIASLKSVAHGSVFDTITRQTFEQLEVNLPNLPTQRRIAEILSALDDRIELNRRMNQTLEQMAQSLFRQYFLDGIDEENLPEGWKLGKLGDVSKNVRKTVNPKELQEECKYVGLEHIPRKSIALTDWSTSVGVESQKYKFDENHILFGKLRPYFHKVILAPFEGICSTDILVIEPLKDYMLAFCLLHYSSEEVVQYSNQLSHGTRMPRADWKGLSGYEIAIPTTELLIKFNNLILPSLQRIKANIEEIQTLTQLRDTLLPKLMSGEIDVMQTKLEELHEPVFS